MLLTSGRGSSIQAECISQGNAGILYGLSGVCHQAANRVSFSAQLKATGAGGYPQSVFTFGEYGRSFPGSKTWEAIKRGCRSREITFDENVSEDSRAKLSDTRYDEREHPMVSISPDNEPSRLIELSELVQRGLGRGLSDEKFQKLSQIQMRLRDNQAEIARRLLLNEISREQYISLFDDILTTANDESETLLGSEDFKRIFGAKLRAPDLIDLEVFLK